MVVGAGSPLKRDMYAVLSTAQSRLPAYHSKDRMPVASLKEAGDSPAGCKKDVSFSASEIGACHVNGAHSTAGGLWSSTRTHCVTASSKLVPRSGKLSISGPAFAAAASNRSPAAQPARAASPSGPSHGGRGVSRA